MNHRPRILLVAGGFPLASETFVREQCLQLVERGVDLEILALRPGDGTWTAREQKAAIADRILAAVKRGVDGPLQPLENLRSRDENAQERMRIDAIWSALSLRCLADGIAPNLLTSRASLARWYLDGCDGQSPEPLFSANSWRWDAAGEWLEAFLNGKANLDLRWGEGRLHREDDGRPE